MDQAKQYNWCNPIDSEVFCKERFKSQSSRWGLHPGCALDLTDERDVSDEKTRDSDEAGCETLWDPKLIVTYPRVSSELDQQHRSRTNCQESGQ